MNRVLKKITALFLAVLLGTICLAGAIPASADEGIAINEINFPDPVFRAVVGTTDAKDGIDKYEPYGVLTQNEIDEAETLYISGIAKGEISDLKGIEFFTACKALRITNLGIEKIDLSALVNLESLSAHGTNKFTSLDLTENTVLKSVSVQGNKNLTELKLPPSVTKVFCYECSLKNLDLSSAVNLEELSCYKNELTSLDVTANSKLTLLKCSNNHIAELDLSQNKNLAATASDYNLGSQTLTATAEFDGAKYISVPFFMNDPSMITETNLDYDDSYKYERNSFVFTDYSILLDGIDYLYNVKLDDAEDMSVHIDVSKNFYKVSYLDGLDGNEINYQLINAGESAEEPELPALPEGMVCGHYSDTAENVQSDMTIYAVWQAEHTEAVTAFENNVATISCSSCGTAPRTVAFADCLNLTSSDAGYEPLLDVNGDGIINARDLAELSKMFK